MVRWTWYETWKVLWWMCCSTFHQWCKHIVASSIVGSDLELFQNWIYDMGKTAGNFLPKTLHEYSEAATVHGVSYVFSRSLSLFWCTKLRLMLNDFFRNNVFRSNFIFLRFFVSLYFWTMKIISVEYFRPSNSRSLPQVDRLLWTILTFIWWKTKNESRPWNG